MLSFITCFLAWAGAIARTAGVLVVSDDKLYCMQFILSLVLNTIIIFQFVLYWNSDKAKTDEDSKAETKKTR